MVLGEASGFSESLKLSIASGKRHPMDAKKELARRIVAQFHGLSAAKSAEEDFVRVFSQDALPENIEVVSVCKDSLGESVGLAKLLAECGLAPSSSEARRLIQSGAVKVDNERADNPSVQIRLETGILLQIGKRKVCKIKVD